MCVDLNDGPYAPISTPNVFYSSMMMEIYVLSHSHADQYKLSQLSCP